MQKHSNPKLSLIEHFSTLPDPRVDRTKDLIDILIIAICTLLCGGETFDDMEDFGEAKHDWFKTFLALRNGIPSHDTFNRVFAAIDPKEFLDFFCGGRKACVSPWRRKSWRRTARCCAGRSTKKKISNTSSAPGPSKTAWCWASSKWTTKATRSRPCRNSCVCWNCPVAS